MSCSSKACCRVCTSILALGDKSAAGHCAGCDVLDCRAKVHQDGRAIISYHDVAGKSARVQILEH